MPPAALIAGGAIVSGVGSAIAGGQQADASKKAAQLQADAARRDAEQRQGMYEDIVRRGEGIQDITERRLLPYMEAGRGAAGRLGEMLMSGQLSPEFEMSPEEFYQQQTQPFQFDPSTDPGAQFRQQQGLEALEKSAAARGGYFSGQTGKALQDYGQGLASQEYDRAFGRDLAQRQFAGQQYYGALGAERQKAMDLYNMLYGTSQMGQTGATNLGSLGMQSLGAQQGAAGMMQSQYSPAAMAQAQGIIGAGQAGAGVTQGITSGLMGALGQYGQYDLMNRAGMFNQPTPGALGPAY